MLHTSLGVFSGGGGGEGSLGPAFSSFWHGNTVSNPDLSKLYRDFDQPDMAF
jgi:hypothetical protein